ncbi:unnamed protein product [Leptosia nina]|uniref:Uncharacterized protein n=1 Tax=Leptosia nina TaxID=320188 RepID=A0AAV1IVQ1_9NEOP
MTDSLKIKANKEYKVARKTILILINALFDLQKLSLNSNPDPALLKEYRQRCFSLISRIYSQLLKHTSYPNEAEELYKFLLSINQQTGDIIKRIGTGNKKIISDECFCREDKCAASVCSRKCQKACAVKPRLTKYVCSGNNKSVDIDHICDGFNNCPMKDDEQDCRQDICRSYHLAILRLKVEKVGSKQKGTAMGEVLSTWKAKVISTLKVAERTGKPTPKIIKDIIKDILRDLVVTYGSVEEYRRKDNHYALQEFSDIAKSIQDAVRSCGR